MRTVSAASAGNALLVESNEEIMSARTSERIPRSLVHSRPTWTDTSTLSWM